MSNVSLKLMFINFSSHDLTATVMTLKRYYSTESKKLDKKSSVNMTLKYLQNSESGRRGGD